MPNSPFHLTKQTLALGDMLSFILMIIKFC